MKRWYSNGVNGSFHQRLLAEVPRRLADLLGLPPGKVRVRPAGPRSRGKAEVDQVLDAGAHRFVVEFKADGTAAPISSAVRVVRAFAGKLGKKAVPMVVTPYMGDVGRQLCAESGVSWMDLSGNANIAAPGLRIHIKGHANQFKRRGRPGSLFAPKSSRIAHWLLLHPKRAFTQRELAQAVGMGEGFVSRIVRGLEAQEMVSRESSGAVRVRDFDVLLEAWREGYDFSKHHIVRGHIAARSSDEILRQLEKCFDGDNLQHAVTGLAAPGSALISRASGWSCSTSLGSQPRRCSRKLVFTRNSAAKMSGWWCRMMPASFWQPASVTGSCALIPCNCISI